MLRTTQEEGFSNEVSQEPSSQDGILTFLLVCIVSGCVEQGAVWVRKHSVLPFSCYCGKEDWLKPMQDLAMPPLVNQFMTMRCTAERLHIFQVCNPLSPIVTHSMTPHCIALHCMNAAERGGVSESISKCHPSHDTALQGAVQDQIVSPIPRHCFSECREAAHHLK
jgi:hypothetical protein